MFNVTLGVVTAYARAEASFVESRNIYQSRMSTTTTASKPSRPYARHGLSRPPLTIKSHNVMMQNPNACSQLRMGTSSRDMPHANPKSANGRPISISTTNLRNGKGQLVSPRLVDAPPSHIIPVTARDKLWEGNRTIKANLQEDIATPVRSFLSSNITPRSGSRKSRIESPLSTPTGTPNGTPSSSRPVSTISTTDRFPDHGQEIGLGLRKVGAVRTMRSGSMTSNGNDSLISLKRASPDRQVQGWKASSPDNNPMFFHADDVNTTLPFRANAVTQAKMTALTYTNGERDLETDTSSSNTTSSFEVSQSKFIYANGTPDQATEGPKPSTTILTHLSSRNISILPNQAGPPHRPPSPLKETGVTRKSSMSKASPRQHLSLASKGVNHQLEQKSLVSPQSTVSSLGRRSSLKTAGNLSMRHGKSSSVNSIDSIAIPRKAVSIGAHNSIHSLDSRRDPIIAEPLPLATEVQKIEPKSPLLSMPTSPTKPIHTESKIDHLNELAANARRERKVLDLEISNSSLLAINRTLERELRKQNAELRRYRRLTQSGRLSMALSNRSASTRLSVLTSTDTANEISDQEHTLDLDDDLSDDDNESSISSTPLSPTSQSAYDARQRAKDEKRLQLDLSKHQELLIDSQKINQSLKRCLGWTEELITEGKKALEYRVQLSDVEVRGRVLTPDEVEGEVSHRRGLLSPGHERTINPLESTASYRSSFIGVDDDGIDGLTEAVPTPDVDNRENTTGFRDYLDAFGVSWGV
ncbi:hypothetical protein MMC14_007259 [Varicellaria rhodocarpa]|nr:hypothetical protein [Varicellaria rhodocarpa]